MEELVVTDPIVKPEEVVTAYKVRALLLDWEAAGVVVGTVGVVQVTLRDNLGGMLRHQYEGDPAIEMMKWMNTANFSVNSMHKKILQKLSNDGVIPGTVTGAPEPPAADL